MSTLLGTGMLTPGEKRRADRKLMRRAVRLIERLAADGDECRECRGVGANHVDRCEVERLRRLLLRAT